MASIEGITNYIPSYCGLQFIEEINALGLEAYPQPKPLDPIDEEEIALLAWVMLV